MTGWLERSWVTATCKDRVLESAMHGGIRDSGCTCWHAVVSSDTAYELGAVGVANVAHFRHDRHEDIERQENVLTVVSGPMGGPSTWYPFRRNRTDCGFHVHQHISC